jgi:hypothetical protein
MLSEATLPQENEERIAPRELAIARWNLQQFWERRERDRNNEVVGEMLEGWHRFYNEVHSAQMRLVSLAEDFQDEVSRLLSSPADLLVSGLDPFSALGARSLTPFCPSQDSTASDRRRTQAQISAILTSKPFLSGFYRRASSFGSPSRPRRADSPSSCSSRRMLVSGDKPLPE